MTRCDKACYSDKQQAELMRRQAVNNGGQKGGGHVYLCDRCGYFHVTHYSKVEWRRMQRRWAS